MASPTPADEPPALPAPEKPLTRAERVGKVADWIVSGLRPSQLAAEWRRAGWGDLDTAGVVAVFEEAHQIIRLDARILPDVEAAKAKARLEDLYARSLEIQDAKTCLRIQGQIDALVARSQDPFARLDQVEAKPAPSPPPAPKKPARSRKR